LRLTLPLLVTLVVAGCGGAVGDASGIGVPTADAAQRMQAASPRPPANPKETIDPRRRSPVTDAVARVSPSVVTVQTEVVNKSVDPFDVFWGRQSERVLPGLGSGFIVRADGVIITNAHVVNGASSIVVALRDGKTYAAKLIGQDEINDIAVLKIDAQGLPLAPLGDSGDLLIGETAIAIGNPYGFLLGNSEPSVTTGVISGTGRNLVARSEGSGVYVDMIQTDAAINPGNSGGPLVNALGEVIGVNSSIYSPTGGSVGLGFAIPINRVKRVEEDLLLHGAIRRPWIGLKVELPDNTTARQNASTAVTVRSVVPGSPADKAGIQRGDVLLRSRDRPIRNAFDWEAEQLDMRVGEVARLSLRRADREFTITVTVADLPEVAAAKVAVLKELELVTLTPAIRAERSIRSTRGALIYKVSDRVSDELGLEKGDVIVQIDRAPIENAQEAAAALDASSGRGVVRMFFERGGRIYSTDFMIR